jgi:hypothetical protein
MDLSPLERLSLALNGSQMAQLFDDNLISCFTDDNGVNYWVDDSGNNP